MVLKSIVANTGYDPERMSHCVPRMLERKVDGVAVFMSEMEQGLIAQLEERRIPIVFLDRDKFVIASAILKSITKKEFTKQSSTYLI